MLLGGLLTFGMRFSLIYLFGRLQVPETIRKALHYVPPAVLSAIIFPELFLHDGQLNLAPDNYRLLAGLVAVLAAWFSKNTLITIIQDGRCSCSPLCDWGFTIYRIHLVPTLTLGLLYGPLAFTRPIGGW
jgi:branched-subunit amino acid transport protein